MANSRLCDFLRLKMLRPTYLARKQNYDSSTLHICPAVAAISPAVPGPTGHRTVAKRCSIESILQIVLSQGYRGIATLQQLSSTQQWHMRGFDQRMQSIPCESVVHARFQCFLRYAMIPAGLPFHNSSSPTDTTRVTLRSGGVGCSCSKPPKCVCAKLCVLLRSSLGGLL